SYWFLYVHAARNLPSNDTGRLPLNVDFGGELTSFLIFSCGGFFIRPVAVTRRLTISERSFGAEVPYRCRWSSSKCCLIALRSCFRQTLIGSSTVTGCSWPT